MNYIHPLKNNNTRNLWITHFFLFNSFCSYLITQSRRIHFANFFLVPRVNSSGGLALFWKSDVDASVQTSSERHIDVIINQGANDVGGLRVSMVILKLLAKKTPGIYLDLCLIGTICHGCAWTILTRFCLLMRNWGGQIDRRGKCRDLGMLWIIVL